MQKKIRSLLNDYENSRSWFFSACAECNDLSLKPYVSCLFDDLYSRLRVLSFFYQHWKSDFDEGMVQRYFRYVSNFDCVERVYKDSMNRFGILRNSVLHEQLPF